MNQPGTDTNARFKDLIPKPSKRCLRVYAFDPQASLELDTAVINDATIELPWEESWEDSLEKGPVNEYIEVVDFDPVSGCFYAPVDLNDPLLLAQDGLTPSDGSPQFHQQMVFAVAMKTVRSFERALGRPVFWTREADPKTARSRKRGKAGQEGLYRSFVRRLRIYPHAMREPNAYYSPQKTALLFGYFKGGPARDGTGGGWVFTCLSQDIVAHETAHAILHGMWPRSVESCNCDALAFHEAFADIVALFQHFSSRSVVEHQMARSGGAMRAVSLLTGLAQQFGRATGREGPLRFALEMVRREEEQLKGETPLAPDRNAGITEPHKRGQILVAAVFDAFVTIFERRTADLFRIARTQRGDTEKISAGLVKRLAIEADKAAGQVLRMCIRGLDYLPPVDVTFGEYLRAVVTADTDLVPDDSNHYRTAFAEAFRKRGITVAGQSFSSTESLLWDAPEPFSVSPDRPGAKDSVDASFSDLLGRLQLNVTFAGVERMAAKYPELYAESFSGAKAYSGVKGIDEDRVGHRNLRDMSMLIVRFNQRVMHDWLVEPDPNDPDWEKLLGVHLLDATAPQTINRSPSGRPKVEVHSVRISRRQGPDGQMLQQLVVQVTQTRRAYFRAEDQAQADAGRMPGDDPLRKDPDFKFRGGATLLVDLHDGRVRRVIRKNIRDERRLARQRAFLLGDPDAFSFAGRVDPAEHEPFAFMHRSVR